MPREKFNFTQTELNRETGIYLYFTDDHDFIFQEQKSYFKQFKDRRIIEINKNSIVNPVKYTGVQSINRNSMRSIKFDDFEMSEKELIDGLIMCRNFFKVGLISISNEYFSKLNAETIKEFLKDKNGVDFLINYTYFDSNFQPFTYAAILDYAKKTNRKLFISVKYKVQPKWAVHQEAIDLSIKENRVVTYNPFLTENQKEIKK